MSVKAQSGEKLELQVSCCGNMNLIPFLGNVAPERGKGLLFLAHGNNVLFMFYWFALFTIASAVDPFFFAQSTSMFSQIPNFLVECCNFSALSVDCAFRHVH